MKNFIAHLLVGAVSATIMEETEFAFIQYIAKHNKSYSSVEEFNLRKGYFDTTTIEINRLNSTQSSSRHAHNKYSDWSREEWQKMFSNMPKPAIDRKR